MSEHSNDNKTQIVAEVIREKKPETTKQLVSLLKDKLPMKEEEIIALVLNMQSEGKIYLTKKQPVEPIGWVDYLRTEHAMWYWLTLGTSLATVGAVLGIPEDLYPWVYVRYVLGALFILWMPGYSFVRALFPRRLKSTRASVRSEETAEKSLDVIERAALSLGMSLALIPIVGLLLNYTPWGIRLAPIVASILALTLIFSTVAVSREFQIRTNQPEQE